jgi:hypothetical protein
MWEAGHPATFDVVWLIGGIDLLLIGLAWLIIVMSSNNARKGALPPRPKGRGFRAQRG